MTHDHCEDPKHDWRVHLRADYIVEVHATDEETAKQHAEDAMHNGEYDTGDSWEAIEAWVEEAPK